MYLTITYLDDNDEKDTVDFYVRDRKNFLDAALEIESVGFHMTDEDGGRIDIESDRVVGIELSG